MIWSIVTSTLSLSMASGSPFLLHHLEYPIGNVNQRIKLSLSFLFMLVFIPRVMAIALLANVFEDWSGRFEDLQLEKIFLAVFFTLLIIILHIVLQRKAAITLLAKPVGNSDLGNGYEIKGEYQFVERYGYENYIKELTRKAIVLPLFSPCITLFQNSRVLELTSYCLLLTHYHHELDTDYDSS